MRSSQTTGPASSPPRLDSDWRTVAQSSPSGLALATDRTHLLPAHLDLLDRKLVDIAAGRLRRLMVFMPPRHGKSETISKYLPAWFLGMHPDKRVILVSYEADFAAQWGRKARSILEEWGPRAFGVTVDPRSSAAYRWDVEGRKGGMQAAGSAGAITGKGADLLIIDDPVKNRQDADSETIRDTHWSMYTDAARTRLEPGGAIILVMTRWHEDDLAGRILERSNGGQGWEIVNFPALAETDDDALGRKLGEALWPGRYSRDDLLEIQEETVARTWSALFQQRPSPDEGLVFKRAWWRYYDADALPPPKEIAASWDCTFKDTDGSDYVVGQLWLRDLANKYLVAQIRLRMDMPDTIKAILALRDYALERFDMPHRIFIEDAANGTQIIKTLQRRVTGIIPVKVAGTTKLSRAYAATPQIESANVFLPNHFIPAPNGYKPTATDVLVDECASFNAGLHDDQVDALSQALTNMDRSGVKAKVRTGGYREGRLADR